MKLYRVAETHGYNGFNFQTTGILENGDYRIKTLEGVLTRLPEGVYHYRKINDTPNPIFTYVLLTVQGRRDVRLGYTTYDTDELYTVLAGGEYQYSTELDRLILAPTLEEWKGFVGRLPAQGTLQIVSRLNQSSRVLSTSLGVAVAKPLHQAVLDSLEDVSIPVATSKRPVDSVPIDEFQ